MRVLLLECSPLLRRWPKSARSWQDHLPTISQRERLWSDVPQTRVDWPKTRRTGWPPSRFAIRRRHRTTDQLTLSVLAWTLGQLGSAFSASQSLVGPHADAVQGLASDVESTISRTLPLLAALQEAGADEQPSRDDLRSVRSAGWPWNAVADVALVFLLLRQGGAEALARRLIRPDAFPETMFQLSVVGAILVACESRGASITSLRPIGYMTDGPVYRIRFGELAAWDLWCEAARCWEFYGADDKYRELASNLTSLGGAPFQARNIRPDVLLACRETRATVFECKYPTDTFDPGYVAHGLYQASFYAHQLAPAFPQVQGFSIGPSELVPTLISEAVEGVSVGLASTLHIPGIIDSLLFEASRTPTVVNVELI